MLDELPKACDAGCKNDSRGNKSVRVGCKLHLDVAGGQIPISCVLTSASLHDSQAAVPPALMTAERVTNCCDLMDSAYDSFNIREHSRSLGHVPIIEPQKRGSHFVPLSPHERVRFRERTAVERVFSRLKDEFGGRFVRVRGAARVMAHLMFGLLALTADQILRMGGVQFVNAPPPFSQDLPGHSEIRAFDTPTGKVCLPTAESAHKTASALIGLRIRPRKLISTLLSHSAARANPGILQVPLKIRLG